MLDQAEKLRKRQLSLLGKYTTKCGMTYGAAVPLQSRARVATPASSDARSGATGGVAKPKV